MASTLTGGTGAAAAREAVIDRLDAALSVLRVITTVNMVGLTVWRWGAFSDHPVAGAAVVATLVVWTVASLWIYRQPWGRTAPVIVLDLTIAVVAMALSPWIKGDDFNATIPGFWVMGPLLAWAVHWHWRGGLTAGVVLAGVDLAIRDEITQANYGNVFLLLLGGTVLGYMCGSLVRMAVERAEAERLAAIEQERTRLARAVHDGVLQVLALVQRRGAELGGDFADLGRLAGEQEHALRSLIHAQDNVSGNSTVQAGATAAPHDLAAGLEMLATGEVTVVTPGHAVLVEAHTCAEVVAAASACLDNVRVHVGLDAPAWILLEEYPERIVVSVRDEGPGIAPGRLVAAEAEGRLGVCSSIRGRLEDVGGRAEVTSGTWGTEWEFTLPR